MKEIKINEAITIPALDNDVFQDAKMKYINDPFVVKLIETIESGIHVIKIHEYYIAILETTLDILTNERTNNERSLH